MDSKGSGRAPGPFFVRGKVRQALTFALTLVVALGFSGCTQSAEPPEASPSRAARTPKQPVVEGSPTPVRSPKEREQLKELLYVDRSTLYSYDLVAKKRTKLVELPSADIAMSGDGSQFVVVVETDPSADDDAFVAPVLQLGDRDGHLEELGPGRSPIWSPLGDAVAALGTDGSVSVYYAVDGKKQAGGPVDAAGTVENILGWTLGNVGLLLSKQGEATVVEFGGDAASTIPLKIPTSEVWGVSPRKLQLLLVQDSRTSLKNWREDPQPVDLGGGLPADGAWSPDGKHIALVAVKGTETQLLLVDTATGTAEPMPDSSGAQGNVVWSSDSKSFTYVRIDPDNRNRLLAVVCATTSECSPAFSWGQDVTLLALR